LQLKIVIEEVAVWIIPRGPTSVSRVKQTSSVLFYLLYSFIPIFGGQDTANYRNKNQFFDFKEKYKKHGWILV